MLYPESWDSPILKELESCLHSHFKNQSVHHSWANYTKTLTLQVPDFSPKGKPIFKGLEISGAHQKMIACITRGKGLCFQLRQHPCCHESHLSQIHKLSPKGLAAHCIKVSAASMDPGTARDGTAGRVRVGYTEKMWGREGVGNRCRGVVGHAFGTIGDIQGFWWDMWRVWGTCMAHRDTHEGAEGHVETAWMEHTGYACEGGHSWGCGETHGSTAGHVEKHSWTAMGGQQDTCRGALRSGRMKEHVGNVGGTWEHCGGRYGSAWIDTGGRMHGGSHSQGRLRG